MSHPRSADSLLDLFVVTNRLNARELVRSLPPARRASCYAQTAEGARHVFPTIQSLLRWANRTPDVAALCLDNCVWRSFDSFRRNLNQGMPVDSAFDSAELYNWDVQNGARKRVPHSRAA